MITGSTILGGAGALLTVLGGSLASIVAGPVAAIHCIL